MDQNGEADSFADEQKSRELSPSMPTMSMSNGSSQIGSHWSNSLVDPLFLDRCKSILLSAWGKELGPTLESIFRSEVWVGQNLLEKIPLHSSTEQADRKKEMGPALSIGLPFNFVRTAENAEILVWAPRGLPQGVPVCVASSRLTRNLDELDSWFDALRTLAARMVGGTHFFVTATRTTTDRFVRRVAVNFGIPHVSFDSLAFKYFSSAEDLIESVQQKKSGAMVFREQADFPCFLFDVQGCEDNGTVIESRWCPDRFLMEVASEVVLLAVRKGGNIDQAVRRRLQKEAERSSDVSLTRLLISEQTRPKLRSELLSLGAVGWWLYDDGQERSSSQPSRHQALMSERKNFESDLSDLNPESDCVGLNANPVPILTLDEFPADTFLLHWTRRCLGPWPEQLENEYLDDLIFRSERRQHGERSALCRILATGRILATRRLTRDAMPVVSFSNQPLSHISSLTVFRQHLGRWDFVPFGLAIERDWLKQRGAREVLYGDEQAWDSMAEQDKPFFQIARSKTGKIDWTIEKEWRLIGDLNLIEVPLNSIAVFVATQADAEAIREFSRWPIVVLESDEGRQSGKQAERSNAEKFL